MTADPFDLERFVEAQDPVFNRVVAELRAGAKSTHWMWFVFPQMRALGHSAMAVRYGISGVAEAAAYLAHSLLGPRLAQCTQIILDLQGRTASQIFPHPDELKFHSSMTLFGTIAPKGSVSEHALASYFDGVRDEETAKLLH